MLTPIPTKTQDFLRSRGEFIVAGCSAPGVNAVSPGVIATPFHERYSTPERMRAVTAAIPQGRVGTAEDCVGAHLYLASAALSGYVVGQILEVNGGQYMP